MGKPKSALWFGQPKYLLILRILGGKKTCEALCHVSLEEDVGANVGFFSV